MPLHASVMQQIGGGRVPREQENSALGDQPTNLDCRFDSVYTRHNDVAEQDVRSPLPGFFDGLMTVVDRFGLKSHLPEDDGEQIRDGVLVVGNENL